jgi:hypothetical protein
MVYTTARILDDGASIRGVVRDTDGEWQFVDGGDVATDDIRLIHLYHLYARHPHVAATAHLTPGHQTWLTDDGRWHESPLD